MEWIPTPMYPIYRALAPVHRYMHSTVCTLTHYNVVTLCVHAHVVLLCGVNTYTPLSCIVYSYPCSLVYTLLCTLVHRCMHTLAVAVASRRAVVLANTQQLRVHVLLHNGVVV